MQQYDAVLEIETDKVTTEATSEHAGTLLKILVSEGETVAVGTILAYIGDPGEKIPSAGDAGTASAEPPATPATTHSNGEHRSQNESTVQQRIPVSGPPQRVTRGPFPTRVSPVVARMAAEHGLDLGQIEGTGQDGRVTKKDVQAYLAQAGTEPALPPSSPEIVAAPAIAQADPSVAVSAEIVPLTNIRRSIAEHMVRSRRTSPHVTTVFEVDFSAISAHRQAHKGTFARDGARLTFTAYIIAAIVRALKQHPMVNSSWSDQGIVLKREINIGMAAATPQGLIVPVVKDADSLNLLGLARTINDLAERARTNRLRPDDVQGGTFTLTNHGTSGSLFATPIINQPQCGILGVGMIQKRVVVIDDMIAIRPMAYVSLTFDHRILDGASGDAFVAAFKDVLEGWHHS